MLFINPGFPAQRNQAKILGLREVAFDIHDYRGKKLEAKLEELLSRGDITGILYSNPNNPAWTNLTEEELEIIAAWPRATMRSWWRITHIAAWTSGSTTARRRASVYPYGGTLHR